MESLNLHIILLWHQMPTPPPNNYAAEFAFFKYKWRLLYKNIFKRWFWAFINHKKLSWWQPPLHKDFKKFKNGDHPTIGSYADSSHKLVGAFSVFT